MTTPNIWFIILDCTISHSIIGFSHQLVTTDGEICVGSLVGIYLFFIYLFRLEESVTPWACPRSAHFSLSLSAVVMWVGFLSLLRIAHGKMFHVDEYASVGE